jgi:N-acetylneuraminic acid mutarotase
VLIAGGVDTIDEVGGPTNTAEIYDPARGVWTLTGSMHVVREDHSAVLLLNGNVLVSGGEIGAGVRTPTAELYDPQTGAWNLTGSMRSPRSEAEWGTVLLPDGNVLETGGFVAEESPQSSADLYDSATGTWSSAGTMSSMRAGQTAVVLRGNRGVLVMGGLNVPPSSTASVDIYK